MDRSNLRAALAAGGGSVYIGRHNPGVPGEGEVVVRMEACGLCHSDVLIAGMAQLPITPMVLGHEGVGVVEETGERVGVTFLGETCGKCAGCRGGREQYCERQVNHGFRRHGTMAERAVVARQHLVRIPTGLSAELAAPICCAGWTAMGALSIGDWKPGERVVVYGYGGVGQLAFGYAREAGLEVAVVDPVEEKVAMARAAGALELENGAMDGAMVMTGDGATMAAAVRAVKRNGRVVVAGLQFGDMTIPWMDVVRKGLRVEESWLGSRPDLERALALAAGGVVRSRVEVFDLEETPVLLERLRRGEMTGRAVIRF